MKGGVYRMLTKSFLLSGFLYGTKENTLSVNLNGWKTIKMYHNNSK